MLMVFFLWIEEMTNDVLFQNEQLKNQRLQWTEMQQEYEETIMELKRNLGMMFWLLH